VIDTLVTKELEVKCRNDRWWSVRIRPYKTTDNKIDGAVLALLDIDALKAAAEAATQGREFIEAVINTSHRAQLVLDKDLSVQTANEAFYRTFRVKPEETLKRHVYQLGDGQWDIPKLRTLLERILPQRASFRDFDVEHHFPHIGVKRMLLDAHRLSVRGDHNELILLGIEDMTGQSPAQSRTE